MEYGYTRRLGGSGRVADEAAVWVTDYMELDPRFKVPRSKHYMESATPKQSYFDGTALGRMFYCRRKA